MRDVDVEPRGTSYGCIVKLIRPGDSDTSEAMVAAEEAWDCAHYDSDPAMLELEQKGGAGRWGLWADSAPIAAWT